MLVDTAEQINSTRTVLHSLRNSVPMPLGLLSIEVMTLEESIPDQAPNAISHYEKGEYNQMKTLAGRE